ncbi:FAD-dependent oxidoreductase [Umezawaea endophytica]|uniref:FAD-dependent oxidoreductase n=1 Tax=Umezawaea endophytica TaxID=1654476 RepID=A0A9X2VV63_9PSEU|nr:FAD-dependent oxidoreductase [Umezawaea endophytica]MCS7483520.1 FAD-dependent oxidoreductase [Umezawaea endophytica]
MRVCVIGSGISGLATAHYLTDRSDVRVTVLEAEEQYGGRANVTEGGEHCTRLFLSDYHHLLALFREIPGVGGTVVDSLRRCRRFAGRSDGTWVEIDHIYAFLAKTPGLTTRDKLRIARSNRQALLVARRSARSANVLGSVWNWSAASLFRAVAGSRRERVTFAFPGATDEYLTRPWIDFLRARGVEFENNSRVELVAPEGDGVRVVTAAGQESFDAVVFSGFVHDAYRLLDQSGIPRPLDCRTHTHCKAFTIDLDPREEILSAEGVRVYAGAGITTVLQPAERRCVTLAAFPRSTEDAFVLDQVRGQLGLAHNPVRVRTRSNLAPSEAVFVGEYVDPVRLEEPLRGRLYFAGSGTSNSYPLDSGEGACRSAFEVVGRLAADHPAIRRRSSLGLPSAAGHPRPGASRPHPNAPARPRLDRVLWSAATRAAAAVTSLASEVVFDDADHVPVEGPAVYVANHRSLFDVPAGVLAFRHLGVSPRLVVARKYFDKGPFGRVLRAIGALPALRGSDATITAGVAAIRAGDSVAIMPEGKITAPEDGITAEHGRGAAMIALATGVPIVPIAARGTHLVWGRSRPWPLVRRDHPRVVITVGRPIAPDGRSGQDLTNLVRDALRVLEHGAGEHVTAHRHEVAA